MSIRRVGYDPATVRIALATPTLLLLAMSVAGPVRAQEAAADPPDVELCFQRAGEEDSRTIGHMRLVVGARYYERVTVRPGSGDPETAWMDDEERNRRSRALLHVMPPMLRFPLADRTVWGERRRHDLPRSRHDEDSVHWPFDCHPLPLTSEQRGALQAIVDEPFGDGGDRVIDHDFQYLSDNCTTWISRCVARAVTEYPGGGEGEEALVRMLDRRRNTPAKLRPKLERWIQQYGEGEVE